MEQLNIVKPAIQGKYEQCVSKVVNIEEYDDNPQYLSNPFSIGKAGDARNAEHRDNLQSISANYDGIEVLPFYTVDAARQQECLENKNNKDSQY